MSAPTVSDSFAGVGRGKGNISPRKRSSKLTISIDDLNIIKKCEDGFEFEYLDAQGKDTGIFFTVLGAHAAKVQKWAFKQLNNQRSQAAVLAKRGKAEEVRTVEDDVEFAHELMAIRIMSSAYCIDVVLFHQH